MAQVGEARPTPIISVEGEQLQSDRCVWCRQMGDMSESHLIPRSMGGRFAPRITCKPCNNFIGSQFESEVKKNAFLTAAIAKLGLADHREAYRHGNKFDVETDVEMHITKEGMSKVIPKKPQDNQFLGSLEELKKHWVGKLKKEKPDVPTLPLEQFFDDWDREEFEYAGTKYLRTHYAGGKSEMRIDGMTRDPHPSLIFKIVYEFVACSQLLANPHMITAFDGLVEIDTADSGNRIVLSEQVGWRTLSNTGNSFGDYRQLEDIPFTDRHSIAFRLSTNHILYAEVRLFGLLRNVFILGELDHFDNSILPRVDWVLVFPIGERKPILQRYANLRNPLNTQSVDAAVNTRQWELKKNSQ